MTPVVISASRRTDIPAFYMPWFMASLNQGRFEVVNPYNQRTSVVPAAPDQVHTIVFWSKNFGPFLQQGYGKDLEAKGYHLFFNFCINSPHSLLEPHLPPLEERLRQLAQLSRDHGPQTIQWRFDPICLFKDASGRQQDNLSHFETIARAAARAGITACITSFVDLYAKVQRRIGKDPRIEWIDPPMAEKLKVIKKLSANLAAFDIALHLCCEKAVLEALPKDTLVRGAACIPNHRLVELYGPGISLAQDKGQRISAGCNCRVSRDIGSYALHACHHSCLYCYANPAADRKAMSSS